MGIFRDLISNVANAKASEERQKLQYNLGLGDILTTLISNPYTDPVTLSKANQYYTDLMRKHGGKEGKALSDQIGQFLNVYAQRRVHDRAMGIQSGQDQGQGQPAAPQQPTGPYPPPTDISGAGGGGTQAAPGGGANEPQPPTPAGQQEGQPGGGNQGWPTGAATPASLAPQGAGIAAPNPQGRQSQMGAPGGPAPASERAQAWLGLPYFEKHEKAQKGGAFRPVLRSLAGIGGEMLGISKADNQNPLPTKEQAAQLFGMTPAQQAKQAGELAGVQRGAETSASIRATMAQFADPAFRKQMKDQGFKDSEIRDAELRALGVPSAQLARTPMAVYEPDGTKHNWWLDKNGQYYDELGQPVNLGPGWTQAKLSTDKPGGANQMATQLRPGYESAKILMTRQHRKPDGTWDDGWSQQKVDQEAQIQAAIQWERTSGSITQGRERNNERDNALAQLTGIPPPPPWMGDGASFDAQVGAASGRQPSSIYDQPVPKKGEPITDPAAAAALDEFVLRATGLAPLGRADQWSQIRYDYGMRLAMAQLGTDNPFLLSAVFADKKIEAGNLKATVSREAGVETLNLQLHKFGDLLSEAKSRTDSAGVPLLDRYLNRARKDLGDLTGDQATFVGQLETSLNAVSRVYAQVLANNAYQSVSMPHVSTESEARATLNEYMSKGTIDGILEQMYTEAEADRQAYKQRESEIWGTLTAALPDAAKRIASPTAPPQKLTPATPTPRPGKTITTITPPQLPPGQTGAKKPKTGKDFLRGLGVNPDQ